MPNLNNHFQVIVIGGGHAGAEAALAAARMGVNTLLLTHNIETLGQMSCNPAIGGIGKGHLVKEIDAMGGIMARATDLAGIQFRILNASKGPAVRATRAQADRSLYKQAIRHALENQPNLAIFQQAVDDLIVENGRVAGVITQMGLRFYARTVVLTAGTFLAGKIHVGTVQTPGGRAGDPPAMRLAERLRDLDFAVGRLKTGTPPRLDGRTIDYSQLTEQPGDTPLPVFSLWGDVSQHPQQLPCHITYTSEQAHAVIRDNLHKSAMYNGAIEGIGPRYCPSIEDKIVRFADKSAHQIFLEPEGLHTHEVYPNGISTSLPYDVQYEFVRAIPGLENVHITRPGYAIEYDFFDPRGLKPSLETKHMPGLFFAGQINGTTGYEEAAAQGLLSGINAALLAQDKEAWTVRRDQAYLGVLVDDLITRGTQEPYRMFTSRAEYRLILREDNADLRLTPHARELGLISEQDWQFFNEKQEAIIKEQQRLQTTWIVPGTPLAKAVEVKLSQPLMREYRIMDLLRRPDVNYALLAEVDELNMQAEPKVAEQVEVQAKYDGYIERQKAEIERHLRHENTRLPEDLDYSQVPSLSTEVQQKLIKVKPATIGMAARIPGVTPAAISLLLVYLKKGTDKNIKSA